MTVNEVLVMMKMVRERVNDLKSLRTQNATRTSFYGTKETMVVPEYDVKRLDAKVVKLQNWLAVADAVVKTTNAKTEVVGLNIDMEDLLAPVE